MDIEQKNVYYFLKNSRELYPEKTALIYKDNEYTYAEFFALTKKVSAYCAKHTDAQDVVSIFLENSDLYLAAYFGAIGAANICNPIGLRTSDKNIQYQINFSKPTLILTSEKLKARCERLDLGKCAKLITVEEILSGDCPETEREALAAKYCTIMYSSGTTGEQKAVRLSHEVVWNATRNIIDYLKPRHDERYYAILPFSHSFGIGNVHTTFMKGGTVIVADNTINLKKILKEMQEHKITFFAAVPLTLKQLTETLPKEFYALGKTLRTICTNTGPMEPAVSRAIIENLPPVDFFTYYGLTEASRTTFHHFNLYPDKIRSVGRETPNVSLKIIDEQGKELPADTEGEILISGSHVVAEYWKNAKATKKSFQDGWMKTGDFGYKDAEGFIFVTGRKDDIVNIAGEKVSLAEVDSLIQRQTGVKDAASFEQEDAHSEYIIKAVIIPEKEAIEEELRTNVAKACKESLDSFKIPKELLFVKEIPRTEAGKLQRNRLRELMRND